MELPLAVTARCELRSVIRFLCAKNTTPMEIYRQLSEVYGQQCTDIKYVRKWCREFKNGRTDAHDEQRLGRSSVSDEIIAKVERVMLEGRRVTIQELCKLLPDVRKTTIDMILEEHLHYHQVDPQYAYRRSATATAIAAKKRWLKSTANPSINLSTVVKNKRASRCASYTQKGKRKNERNSGNNNPRRKRKGALNVNSNTNAKKQRKSNRLNNTTAPIEEVLIKTEPTNEPIEEVFINQEHITEPVLDIAVKDEPIDPVPEVVIKEECLDDYPVDSQTYKNLQINIKTEEDDEETYATTGQSS